MNYFISACAPASCKAATSASASSLLAPSLIVLGALSTKSFASFKPKSVAPLQL